MCDYSLAGVLNRLAVEAEELVVHCFSTGALGSGITQHLSDSVVVFESVVGEHYSVPPGTPLLLRDIPADHTKASSPLTLFACGN